MSIKKVLFSIIVFPLITLIVTALGFEGVTALFYPYHLGYDQEVPMEDPLMGYKPRANYSKTFKTDYTAYIGTNEYGFRDDPITPHTPDTIRILVLGDSFTFGIGVSNGETFPDYLEEKLNASYPEKKWDVINAGVFGYSTIHYALLLDQYLNKLNPDALLIMTCTNDVIDNTQYFSGVYHRKQAPPFRPFALHAWQLALRKGEEKFKPAFMHKLWSLNPVFRYVPEGFPPEFMPPHLPLANNEALLARSTADKVDYQPQGTISAPYPKFTWKVDERFDDALIQVVRYRFASNRSDTALEAHLDYEDGYFESPSASKDIFSERALKTWFIHHSHVYRHWLAYKQGQNILRKRSNLRTPDNKNQESLTKSNSSLPKPEKLIMNKLGTDRVRPENIATRTVGNNEFETTTYRVFEHCAELINDMAIKKGIPLIYSSTAPYSSRHDQYFLKSINTEGIFYADLDSVFKDYPEDKLTNNHSNRHWTPFANERIAEVLKTFMEREGIVPYLMEFGGGKE